MTQSIAVPLREILAVYWKSDRWALLRVAAVILLSSTAMVAAPYLFSRLIDRLPQEGASAMAWGFIGYAALLGLGSALQHTVQYLSFMSAENLGFIASTRYFSRILKKTTAFFLEHNPAEIQAIGDKGRSALKILVQLGLVAFAPGALQILLTLATLGALIDLQVATLVLVYGATAVSLSAMATRRARVHLEAAVEAGQENARFVGNATHAMETLRQFGGQAWMSQRFGHKAQEVRDHWRAYVVHRVGYIAVLGLGLAIQFAVTFMLLLPRYESGLLSVGDIVLFNILLLQLNQPFEMIARAIDEVARSLALLAPLAALWAAPEERQVPDAAGFSPQQGRVVFDNVGYGYGNGRGIRGVSFQADRGGITFLMGQTGAGKSTVFKLAMKTIDPDAGRILIDGRNLAEIDRADWYAVVAVVPQDAILLNESLADNILLGRARDDARLRDAARKAAVLAFIESLPQGFDTTVGERGLKLSGGERQRIAIARALYGDPAILLLDEASSALDAATELDVMGHIRQLAGDVTVLAITHRRNVIERTDRLVELGCSHSSSGACTQARATIERISSGSRCESVPGATLAPLARNSSTMAGLGGSDGPECERR